MEPINFDEFISRLRKGISAAEEKAFMGIVNDYRKKGDCSEFDRIFLASLVLVNSFSLSEISDHSNGIQGALKDG